MRLLSLVSSFTHGGAETVLVDLVRGLSEHEHCVAHSSATRGIAPHGPFLDALRQRGIRCVDVVLDTLGAPAGRGRALCGFEPDVVIHHWWGRDSLRPWLTDSQDRPPGRRPHFVCVLHHAGLAAPPGYDRYVLVAEAQRSSLSLLPGAHTHLIPNGVDLRRFRRRSQGVRRGDCPVVVGRVSRLTPDKISMDWVRTAASFGMPGVRFVIAGGGPLLPALRAEVDALGVADRFALPGYVSRQRVPALLETFDVFCHVTATAVECHPLAILEAMAAGLPVVAEARGGIPAIVAHGVNGLLASSPGEIGVLLRRLCGDVSLRDRLAVGARRTARRFSLARQLRSYRRLLAEIEEERSGGRRRHLREPVLAPERRCAELTPAGLGQLAPGECFPDLHQGFGVPQLLQRGLA
jgi:glycosyltransferase involved in cell wall biosynthesis